MLQLCKRCGLFSDHGERGGKRKGLQQYCKKCHVVLASLAYERKMSVIKAIKNVPCADCEIQYPYYVMQFDHLGDKEFSISSNRWKSLPKILKEIEKCEVVCANCHLERSWQRQVNGRLAESG